MIEFDNPMYNDNGCWVVLSAYKDFDNNYFFLVSENISVGNCPMYIAKIFDNEPILFDTEEAAFDKLTEYYAYHGHPWNPPAGYIKGKAHNVGTRELIL